ncbi:MAG TPA: 6-phosphogluconolactonase [Polyangia bacterium]|jgi:6-phosphogluconolactonase
MATAPRPDARVLPDAATAARAGAAEVAALLRQAAAAPAVTLALAGGHTPRRLYEELAATPGLPWDRVHLFWGDERCVRPDDAESNYAMADAALIRRVPIPPAHVHRMPAELAPPARAAAAYEETLRGFFRRAPWPALDLVLLGVGPDGHTASLFPGHPALDERELWVTAVETQAKRPPWRLTLTLPALCAARAVLVLATGDDKAAVVAPILRGDPAAARLPAARVHGRERTVWVVDRAAAG